MRGGLVVAQVAIGLVLLCGASVLAATFLQLTRRDLGFRPENLFSFSVELPGPRYSTDGQIDFMDRLLERLKAAPGVTAATVGLPLPLTGDQMQVAFNIKERPTEAEPTALVEHGARRAGLLPNHRHAATRGPRLHR